MPHGQVLEFSGVTKRFGAVTAVSGFTARVEPGLVTGFLGPNGAGKTTSLRILLGLVRPTEGDATIGGVHYAKLPSPLQTVGAVLEASSFHPGRTGAAHLTVYAQAARIPKTRVDEVLGLVGLADAAGRKVGGYSLGMRQRLGLAYALLGDPGVLVLDEPTNGLDPEGIKWIRGFLRQLAREGRTVLVSSHLLTEVQQTVDALLIISQGRLVFQGGLDELVDPSEQATVVDSSDRAALAEALRAADVPFEVLRSGLTVRGIEPAAVGLAAAAAGVPLSTLHKRGPALEEVFLDLVNGTRLHASASGTSLNDVIPAIESGAIAVVTPAEQVQDAEPAAAADADSEAAAPGAGDAEASAADTASIAAELDAEASGAAAAGALGAAAGMVWAEEHRGSADAESDGGTAAFAVASTGVIDIIPTGAPVPADAGEGADDATEQGTLDEDTTLGEPHVAEAFVPVEARGADEPLVDEEATAGEAADHAPEQALGETEDADADAEAIAAIDAELSDDEPFVSDGDDRPWEDYVKTDADLEADRFFAAFDAEKAAAAAAQAEAAAREESSVTAEGAESGLEAESEAEPEPATASESEPEPEPESESEAEWSREPESEVVPAHEAAPQAEAVAESAPEAEVREDEASLEGDAAPTSETEPEPEPEPSDAREDEAPPEGDAEAAAEAAEAGQETSLAPDAESPAEHGGHSDQSEHVDHDEHPEHPEHTEHTELPEHTEQPEHSEQPERTEHAEPAPPDDAEPSPDDGDQASAPDGEAEDDGLGTLSDLSPDWVEHDVHERRDDEGGEQR